MVQAFAFSQKCFALIWHGTHFNVWHLSFLSFVLERSDKNPRSSSLSGSAGILWPFTSSCCGRDVISLTSQSGYPEVCVHYHLNNYNSSFPIHKFKSYIQSKWSRRWGLWWDEWEMSLTGTLGPLLVVLLEEAIRPLEGSCRRNSLLGAAGFGCSEPHLISSYLCCHLVGCWCSVIAS